VEAIATLHDDPQQRRRRIEAGLRIARGHTLEHEAAAVAEFLLDGVDSPIRRFAARLPPPLQALTGRSVLNLRCGEGETALLMAELGAGEVLGVDTCDMTRARLNRQRADPALGARVRFERVDGATWRPPAGAYDLIVLRDDFTGELDQLLDWARRAAAPGGSVAIEFCPGRVTLTEFADAMARSRLHCTWYRASGRHGPIVSVWTRPLYESPVTAPSPDLASVESS
jgi:SAM-dependent methyltransferase